MEHKVWDEPKLYKIMWGRMSMASQSKLREKNLEVRLCTGMSWLFFLVLTKTPKIFLHYSVVIVFLICFFLILWNSSQDIFWKKVRFYMLDWLDKDIFWFKMPSVKHNIGRWVVCKIGASPISVTAITTSWRDQKRHDKNLSASIIKL